jgi:hypothetical protein
MKQQRNDDIRISMKTLYLSIAGLVVISIALLGLFLARRTNMPQTVVEFPHIHGLGYSPDGSSLYVPAHIGLIVYKDGGWSIPDIPKHDYMGYAAVDDGFYSSGHPDLRTDFEPLLGLVKSIDNGQSITSLAFEGESDFHLMGAGYENHAVYVFNASPNSRLGIGFYYSLDDGQTWEQSRAEGLSGEPIQIAVHPLNPEMVAVASSAGAFLSTDHGDSFTQIGDSAPVSAITFDTAGQALLLSYDSLNSYDIATQTMQPITTPALAQDDAISNAVFNPVSGEIALATFKKDIFLSQNGRQEWKQIAQAGVGL